MTKSKETRDKALVLFLEGKSEVVISKEVNVTPLTITKWKKKYKWKDIRDKTEIKTNEKISEKYSKRAPKLLNEQADIVERTQKELIDRLNNQDKINEEIEELKKDWAETCAQEKPSKSERELYYTTLNSLYQMKMQNKDLITVLKHGLDLLRPKQTTNNTLNVTKQDNLNIDVDIPRLLQSIRNGIKE